ncbi:MAG: DUF4159 domain-containing protein [Deltaproteobacteria bacterium]|nr:DUF4159 domain-containing protein [Deltaproteobacteria bacterium]
MMNKPMIRSIGYSATTIFLFFLIIAVNQASANSTTAGEDHNNFTLALIRYSGGNWNPRPHALERLAWEIRRRTSIAINLNSVAVEFNDDIFNYPLLIWEGEGFFPNLPEKAIRLLHQHLLKGGTLFIDISDAKVGGPFDTSIKREIKRILPRAKLKRIDTDHVIYKSFYLLDRHGGRVIAKPYLEGIFIGDRLAVVISSNDLAGAIARDEFGRWEYDVGPGGDSTREMSFRMGVNLVMYALCLDYKDDQVHIPFILQRRR